MEEIWKTIDWLSGMKSTYEVSNLGRVRRIGGYHHTFYGDKYIESGFMLSPYIGDTGYPYVRLYQNGKQTHHYVHKLVATAFIPNPNGYDVINHKNENRSDNRVENLEWCTATYNARYSSYKNRHPIKKPKQSKYGRSINFRKGKYETQCFYCGKSNYLGRFENIVDARKARNDFWDSLGLLEYLTEEERELKA